MTRVFSRHAEVAIEPGPSGAAARVVTASLSGRLGRAATDGEKSAVVAGDRVVIETGGGEPVVVERLARSLQLSRRHPRLAHVEQVVAANVDRVLVVASVVLPPLRPGLVDRYLVSASAQGLEAAICLTKTDLVDAGDVLAIASRWNGAAVPLFPVSIRPGSAEGVEELAAAWLAGHATVLVGQSAVGKSTLRNALLRGLREPVATAEVSAKTGRGQHVTTAATWEPLAQGAFLVDTAGCRQFDIWNLCASEVSAHFPEFAGLACRFADCAHEDDAPGCALARRVREGGAPESRLSSLRAIAASLPR